MAGLCNRVSATDLGKLFDAPALASYGEQSSDDAPMGPYDVCNYKQADDKLTLDLKLVYQCHKRGAAAAAPEYKGLHDAVATAGGHMESLPDLGDEAYWYYSGNAGLIQGHIKARKGGILIDVAYATYRLGDKAVDPLVAKQHAIEAAKRLFAAAAP